MRKQLLDTITETMASVPDNNLPLLNEAAVLLTHLTPPWYEKCTFETPLVVLLMTSMNSETDLDPLEEVNDGYITAEYYDPSKE